MCPAGPVSEISAAARLRAQWCPDMSMLVEEIADRGPAKAGITVSCSRGTEFGFRVPEVGLLSREPDIAASNYCVGREV